MAQTACPNQVLGGFYNGGVPPALVIEIMPVGIDLGETTFHLVALGTGCQVVMRKKSSRQQLLWYTVNLPSS
jgi:hypothetical protein